ncbi:hypothetical protein TKK_0008927 [Trichogramma kaykai]|uniref:SMP-LTD domain-containing protein n=1 Tax=Trichogramma kaykai TaxID=54128 RepID=A0ABD2X2P9_9HYME
MSSKNSPAKITLGMIKGKPITMSVPVIRYHASDDELEELYPSTDEEKHLTPESEKSSPRPSPRKSCISIGDNDEGNLDRRSMSIDDNLSEGTTWRVLSDIKGKITKTFEDKISEMKHEKKKSKTDRSRDTSSLSDYEDLNDVTPTDENGSEKPIKDSSPVLKKRTHSSRFVGFSYIKTGIKTKKAEDDSVESGIEAAEAAFETEDVDAVFEDKKEANIDAHIRLHKNINNVLPVFSLNPSIVLSEYDKRFIQLKNRIYYQFFLLIIVLICFYFIPIPKYLMGICAGIFGSTMVQKIYKSFYKLLTIPTKTALPAVTEITAVQEHVIVEKFEGWLNELPYRYEPENYHVARTKPVFLKLEGENLQLIETRTRIPKRAVWDEAKHKPKFTKKRVYNLADSKVDLLPSGLIRRRRWSKKYPICVTFDKDTVKESILQDNSSDEEPQVLDIENDKIILEEDETDEDISNSKDVFEDCQDDASDEGTKIKLYLFARTDRQKEDWYRRLILASKQESKRSSISSSAVDSKPSTPSLAISEMSSFLTYQAYMARYVENLPTTPSFETKSSNSISHDGLWINALFGRILFDMHKCPDMINALQDKIQRKLSNIKLPYFMESLTVSELVIGQGAPIIHSATKPLMNERGLWFDLEITYEGSLTMTIETKLNLMKLKRTGSVTPTSNDGNEKLRPARSPMFDSDVEDSPETSTEEEDSISLSASPSSKDNTPTQSSGKKFLNMVDKLASNKYFQHATELSYIKKAMEGVSKTEIRLMVSVSSIEGCLSVNIPPPPTDRLWYGFKPVPKINLTAKPAVGERAFNIGYVTKWIETKLLREFEKVVVLPNMDDLVIPLCPNYPY